MATKSIGERLGQLVRARGIKQREISREVDLSPSQITRFLNGESEVKAEKFTLILEFLGINISAQIDREVLLANGMQNHEVTAGDLINEVIGTLSKTKRTALIDFVSAYAMQNAPPREHKRISLLKDLI